MGTHPIFESDFDCLTESPNKKCQKLHKPVHVVNSTKNFLPVSLPTEKVAVKKSMRNFNNALQTTLPRERNNSLTPPCGQLSIPVLSRFSICNYHNSLPNKLFRVSVQFMFYFFFSCNNT